MTETALFIDARSFDGQTLDADLCIIGAGAAGITMALQFADTGVAVLLLESGDLEPDEKTQALASAENASFVDFSIETTRLRFFGGTTNHWGGQTYPLSQFDFQPRAFNSQTGWPIEHADLADYYPQAGKICQLGSVEFGDVRPWQKRAGMAEMALNEGPIRSTTFQFSPPTRFGQLYRDKLAASANIRVLLNANVQEIVTQADAAHATAVVIKTLSGARLQATSRKFVIAMGGLESARLLLLSRSQQANGLGNAHDMVGRYYADHVGMTGGSVAFASAVVPDFFTSQIVVDAGLVQGLFTPTPETLAAENIGNFRIELKSSGSIAGVESLRTLETEPFSAETLKNIGSHIENIVEDFDQVANVIYKNVMHRKTGFLSGDKVANASKRGVTMHISAEQSPNRESRVMLSEQRDAFGQQKLKLQWQIQPIDRRTIRRAYELFASAIGAAGLGRVRIPSELNTEHFDSMVEIACHHSGTTRMSRDPQQGVVDANCRVHGVDNLYVASSGVFPTYSWANPTLTIVALSLRLSRHLATQFG